LNVLARVRLVSSDWRVHLLDFLDSDKARMPAGVLLTPLSTVSLAGVERVRGCDHTYDDRFGVPLIGVAMGEVMLASVGKGVVLAPSALA
jgi:hypothetical protein